MTTIEPAAVDQIVRGRDGREHWVEADMFDVAKQVRSIDPSLRVTYNEIGECYKVIQTLDDGSEKLVFSVNTLDSRVLDRLRRLSSPDYDMGKEMDRIDKQADKDKDHAFAERVGPLGERLAHALRHDLEVKSKIILPRGV